MGDLPGTSWIPTFAADEVAGTGPSYAVGAAVAVGVLMATGAVGPPGVEVASI